MARIWKFVGGSTMPKTSLQACINAVLADEAKGACAIFNSETGDLYDLLGNEYPPITSNQYQAMVGLLAVVFVHTYHEIPMSKDGLLPLMAQIGDPVFSTIKKAASEYAAALVQLKEAGAEIKDVGNNSGSVDGPVTG